ncbi:MAG: hypothetical protein HC831_12030, partial [Chloroflexia bacterium]|nr:hypothetical protein [Chloroflexia bacterium]
MKFLFSTLLFLGIYTQIVSQELEFTGFVDSYHAWRVESPYDIMSSRSRFRAQIKKSVNNVTMFVSANAIYNSRIPELTKLELREAYLNFATKSWNVKAGRQIVVWGQADGLPVTDVISPLDLTEFLAQDYDDIRMPVNAFR